MPSTNIGESFNTSLPDEVAIYWSPDAHVSGPSTQMAEPPGFALQVRFQDAWNVYANDILRRVNLSRHKLASWEDTRQLLVEADVSDAAAAHLINPIDLALSARYPGQITCLNQHAITPTVRADKCWLWGNEESYVAFAVLDYKRTGVIRDSEIESAFVRLDDFQWHEQMVAQDGSRFGGNALILLKQAVNYADQYQTQYVAFFDWNTLLLLVLDDQEGPNGGIWCHASLIRNRGNMRRALLGFLARAYQASLGDNDLLPLIPPVAGAAESSGRKRRRRR